jgi:hypothetical protein
VLDRTGQSLLVADLAAQYELSEAEFGLEARA